jgi:outer membrane protein assembly factor BamE (lipoprotein component of BamABCDE complex)
MKSGLLAAAALVATALAGAVSAETIVMGDGIAVRESAVAHPDRGMSMSSVEAKFGQPANRHNAVGQPPITRWDYPGFSVYFEHQFVIHAVVSGS